MSVAAIHVQYNFPYFLSVRLQRVLQLKNAHKSVTVQNRTHVYMNVFDHKDLGNHLLQHCPQVVKHPVYIYIYTNTYIYIHTHTQYIYTLSVCVYINTHLHIYI